MLNRLVAAAAEGMSASMLDHVRTYETAWESFTACDLNDMASEDPVVAASFFQAHEAMTTAFHALLVARPTTARDQRLRAMALLRRIAEDEISADDVALLLSSML